MLASVLFQPPIPGEETLLELSEKGVGVILALSILLLFAGAILAILLVDRWQTRQATKTQAAEAKETEEGKSETSQILELARAIGVLATTNSASLDRQSAAIEKQAAAQERLASSTAEQSALFRQFVEQGAAQTNEHERISRAVAAEAVDTVMNKLAAVESKLRGPVMVKQLDELIQDMAAIKKLLSEPPHAVMANAAAPVVSANEGQEGGT